MTRGRKPKPTADKAARGNPGQRPLNQNEPQPKGQIKPPRWMSDLAQKEWKRLAPELERIGVLTMADQTTFATYCQSVADYINAVNAMKDQPTTIQGYRGGLVRHPGLTAMHQAAERMLKMGSEFGLTPSSRGRISVPKGAAPGSVDDFVDGKPDLKLHG